MLLNVLTGCFELPEEKTHLIPAEEAKPAPAPAALAEPGEIDIVEELAAHRQAYRQALALLVDYYSRSGDHTKMTWARREHKCLTAVPQYRYLLEAEFAGPDLRATTSIPQADELYDDAMSSYKKARGLVIFVDEKQLGIALDKLNQLITKYPSSDKIDDAAFTAAEIYRHFKDYSIAAVYYNRVHQWDPQTTYPSRFKTAYILDWYLKQRSAALPLYQQAMEKEMVEYPQYREFVAGRINELAGPQQAEE